MTVVVLTTGGTIASHFDGEAWSEVDGTTLVRELGGPDDLGTDVEVIEIASGPSSNLGVSDFLNIAERVAAAIERGADGVVVVHGTDTLELSAFTTQLLIGTSERRPPVVFTGAMRVHSHVDPDGPANLRDSIALAASVPLGRPVMVCLDGRVHLADRVHKTDASSVDAFDSRPFEPMVASTGANTGSLGDRFPRGAEVPPSPRFEERVGLAVCHPGMSPATVEAAALGMRGLVVEGFGDLNLPRSIWPTLRGLVDRGTPVVVSSRAFTPTVDGELLNGLGAIGAGGLDAQRARLATMAALGSHPTDVRGFLRRLAIDAPAERRST